MSLRNPYKPGEWINRDKQINFTFEGEAFTAYQGDTISSALWAENQKILGRSFKYHRPRGILSLANHDVNILMTDGIDTNIRADVVEVKDGMQLYAVNTIGGVKKDKNRQKQLYPHLPPLARDCKTNYRRTLGRPKKSKYPRQRFLSRRFVCR